MRKNSQVIGMIVLSFVLTSCGFKRTEAEKIDFFYRMTLGINETYIPATIRQTCGIDDEATQTSRPFVQEVNTIETNHPEIVGRYYKKDPRIEYVKGNEQALIHEFQHHLNAQVSPKCVDEIAAYFAETIYKKDVELYKLKQHMRWLKLSRQGNSGRRSR